MVNVKHLGFPEPKKLPNLIDLREVGIGYRSLRLYNFNDARAPGYLLSEFVDDYYRYEFQAFRERFYEKMLYRLDNNGYLVYNNKRMPIRDLAFFANKERKFVQELNDGRERGRWVKTVYRNINITTSHTHVVEEFIDAVIRNENLHMSDIIMLKYLKRVNSQVFSMYKVFSSIDVRDKRILINKIKAYGEGFFGKNNDYSEDIDRLEIDIIKSLQGGCRSSEMRTNDERKRIVHHEIRNNNCFFKCIQPFVPEIREKVLKSECNKIRSKFGLAPNSKVDLQTGMKIFEFYSQNSNGLEIGQMMWW